MHVRLPCPSKDFVTAPSPLKKKISILTGYSLLESEGCSPAPWVCCVRAERQDLV